MKKRIYFKAPKETIIFKDSKSENAFYGITESVLMEKIKIVKEFGDNEADVPDEYKIEVTPFQFVNHVNYFTDEYAPTKNIVEFPINRIEWIYIHLF